MHFKANLESFNHFWYNRNEYEYLENTYAYHSHNDNPNFMW